MGLLGTALGALFNSVISGLFGWMRQRQADENALRADRAEVALSGRAYGEQLRQLANAAQREALSEANPDISDWT